MASSATAQHVTVCTTRPHILYKRIIFRLNRMEDWIHYGEPTEQCISSISALHVIYPSSISPFVNSSFFKPSLLSLHCILLLYTVCSPYSMLHTTRPQRKQHFFVTALEGRVTCLSSFCFSLHLLWATFIGTFKEITCNPPLLPTPFPLTFSPFCLSLFPLWIPPPLFPFHPPSPIPPPVLISPSFFSIFIMHFDRFLHLIISCFLPFSPYFSHFLPLSPPTFPLKLSKGINCPLSLWGDSGGHSTACYTLKPNSLLTHSFRNECINTHTHKANHVEASEHTKCCTNSH